MFFDAFTFASPEGGVENQGHRPRSSIPSEGPGNVNALKNYVLSLLLHKN